MVPGLTERDMRATELRRRDLLAEVERARTIPCPPPGQRRWPHLPTLRVRDLSLGALGSLRAAGGRSARGLYAAVLRLRGAHP